MPSWLVDAGMSISNGSAALLDGLTGGLSTDIAGSLLGFDPRCLQFDGALRVPQLVGTLAGLAGGLGEAGVGLRGLGAAKGEGGLLRRLTDRFADERGSIGGGNSITTKLRRTPSTDQSESIIIRERTSNGQTVQVVHQVGKPLPGGGVLITHQDIKYGPLPGSQVRFPEVNP